MRKIVLLILVLFISCNNPELTFKHGNQRLYLDTRNNGKPIRFDESFDIILRFENINIDGMSLEGATQNTRHISNDEIGIKMLFKSKLATAKQISDKIIMLRVGFKGIDNKQIFYTFKIPVE